MLVAGGVSTPIEVGKFSCKYKICILGYWFVFDGPPDRTGKTPIWDITAGWYVPSQVCEQA